VVSAWRSTVLKLSQAEGFPGQSYKPLSAWFFSHIFVS